MKEARKNKALPGFLEDGVNLNRIFGLETHIGDNQFARCCRADTNEKIYEQEESRE